MSSHRNGLESRKVIQRILPPSRSQRSQISCASEIVMVFNNIDKAISGSAGCSICSGARHRNKKSKRYSLATWYDLKENNGLCHGRDGMHQYRKEWFGS